MTQLRSLSLQFLPAADYIGVCPSGNRVILPVLTYLKYRGTSEYLDNLVARIDAPRLEDIEFTFFDEFMFDVSNLSEFINRVERQRLHHQADILFSERSVSILLTQPALTCLKLQVICDPLRRQVSSIAQICSRFSAFLFRVEDLRIKSTRLSSRQDGAERWLKLICSFRGMKWFHVAGDFSTNIVLALHQSGRRRETVLPAMHKLCIREPEPHCAPLRAAVLSFMVTRRLSGHFIGVEYERREIAPCSQHVMLEMLSDDVLLNTFRHYRDASPRFWSTLVHVCKRWRRITFTSPLGLDLRLYCTYGTPVLRTLDYWPPLPIVVQYGGSPTLDPPGPEDEGDVVAALKHSDRVSSIGLTITTSLLGNLFAIEKPFSKLEMLVLRSSDDVQLTLPSTLQWGTRLRSLHSTRIAFPALPQLLSSSENLVDLQLHEVPSIGYLSPKAFANALSGTTQLQSLSLHFLSPTSISHPNHTPSPVERVVLPALFHFKFRGTSEYLNNFVTRIDAPRLGDIQVRFFNQLIFYIPQLGLFIDRIDMQKSHRRIDIVPSERSISICFTQPGSPTRFGLQISCEQLEWQLSSITQICDQLSPFLSRVENIGIYTTHRSTGKGGEQWVELIRTFGDAKDFRVAGELATDILRALRPSDGELATMLPSLRTLGVPELGAHGPLWEAVESFVTPYRHSGHLLQVYKVTILTPY
ncbi:hypothetical protein EDB92DRAFT_216609 [Lactarius akahatsu]|uniref:Uncharacterized protein n=1 Tax=Lactarius akahatsu TaxID=416441 RepID=A0AAD4LC73_9AGAM|nr:hypothetical protein EDB92DRAFT_216609 [Lactarius akahatsu]